MVNILCTQNLLFVLKFYQIKKNLKDFPNSKDFGFSETLFLF